MPTKEELEAQLKQLQEDLKKSQDKSTPLETKSKAPVYVAREKKIDKFTGSPSDDVDEWTEHILSHVNTRFHSVREKAEFIFDHLGGAARSVKSNSGLHSPSLHLMKLLTFLKKYLEGRRP